MTQEVITILLKEFHIYDTRVFYIYIYIYIYIYMTLQVADACECGNEPSGSVKCGEFLD